MSGTEACPMSAITHEIINEAIANGLRISRSVARAWGLL